MAAVALQRELDAYADAIDKYNRQARNYKTAATAYNEKLDVWNAAMYQKPAKKDGKPTGEQLIITYLPAGKSYGGGYWEAYNPSNKPISGPPPGYKLEKIPGTNEYLARKIDAVDPGKFTMTQPTVPGAAPSATAGQMRRLDAPSLSDLERNQSSGLIGSAFNF
jgi:hypothetical protein